MGDCGIMTNTKIYISYHKKSPLFKSDVLYPIHVGRALADKNQDFDWLTQNMIGDDTGDNISSKNPNYCELTAQYWAWKNDKSSDYIGFMHYRRHLNFNTKVSYSENKWGLVDSDDNTDVYIEKFGLNSTNINSLLSEYDIITVAPWSVDNAGSKNNYDHYKSSDPKLHIEDYDKTLQILRTKYPEYSADVEKYNSSGCGYYTNIYVMKRSIFNDYCEWLFDILFEVEKLTDISGYDFQEARIFGYLSEWLFGIYLTHIKRERLLKVKELQRTVLNNMHVQDNSRFNVCFATDNNYAQHCGVAVTSLLKNTKCPQNFDILILNDGSLSRKNRQKFKRLEQNFPGTNIFLLTIDNSVFKDFPIMENTHFTEAVYYRFIIPKVLNKIDKIVYLDSDLVVNSDLVELFNVDIGENYIGAVQDIIGYENQERLNLNSERYYCNSGVLIMNLKAMRNDNISERLINWTNENKELIMWPDQDVINVVLEDKIYYLDLSWNLQEFPNAPYDFDKEDIDKAVKSPKIIHYIGHIKPWQSYFKRMYSNKYFEMLLLSPWKGRIVKIVLLQLISAFKNMFYIRNVGVHKVISILGIKLKIKLKRLEERELNKELKRQSRQINSAKKDLSQVNEEFIDAKG